MSNLSNSSQLEKEEAKSGREINSRIKEKFVEWSQSSTSHGYPNIFRTKNHILRIMWFVFFLAGIGTSAYLVVTAIQQYLEFGVTTTIRRLRNESLLFPAVSVCNLNPFASRDGALHVYNYIRNIYGPNVTSIVEARALNPQVDQKLEMLRLLVASSSFNSTLRQTFGYSYKDMFLTFMYNSKIYLQPQNVLERSQ